MNFGEALNAVKNGKKAKRAGWNGKDQFIELATNVSFVRPNGEVVNVNHKDMGNKAIAFHGTSGITEVFKIIISTILRSKCNTKSSASFSKSLVSHISAQNSGK